MINEQTSTSLPSHVLWASVDLIVSKALKLVTVNTCVLSGSVAMEFNSAIVIPLPTPTENTVTP